MEILFSQCKHLSNSEDTQGDVFLFYFQIELNIIIYYAENYLFVLMVNDGKEI